MKGKNYLHFNRKKYSVYFVTELEIWLLKIKDMRLQWIWTFCLIFSSTCI